ncbi:MAG: hypothetical protein Q8L55_16150, partial [Phycisphaerales bacterium]|nr:hypothetical protein [Phycisphaerales bacterium]
FGDQLAPSSGFSCAELPSKAGSHDLTDAYQRRVSLEVVSAVVVPVRKLHPEAFAEGDEFSCVWGWLKGTTGTVPVLMGAIHKPSLMGGSTGTFMYVVRVLTSAEIAQTAQCERILAGARVVDSFSGKSHLLSQMAGSVTAMADTSDLSTLFSADPNSGTGDSTVDCLSIAYKRFAVANKSNAVGLAICLASAAAGYAVCAAGCLAILLAPSPISIIGTLGCEVFCLAALVVVNKLCEASYRNTEALNLANLLLDLQACGVHVAAF